MNKKNSPCLKLKTKNEFFHKSEGGETSPHSKTLIDKRNKLIQCQGNMNNKKEEDLILIPYKEGTNEIIWFFSLNDFKINIKIINIYILSTNCFTYHDPRTIDGYINKLEKIISQQNEKNNEKYFVEITKLYTTTNEKNKINFLNKNKKQKIEEKEKSIVILNKKGDNINVKLDKNPNYIYFIIIEYEGNKIYIFDPISNRTIKHYYKKNDSYLKKVSIDDKKKGMMIYHYNSIFEDNSTNFRNILVYELNSYEIISLLVQCIDVSSKIINLKVLLEILKIMQSQSNNRYNVSNKTSTKDNSLKKNTYITENEDSRIETESIKTEMELVQTNGVNKENENMNLYHKCIDQNTLNKFLYQEDCITICTEIFINERKFLNAIYMGNLLLFWDKSLWDKLISLKEDFFLGHYEMDENRNFNLYVDEKKVAQYNIDDNNLEILDKKKLNDKISSVEKLLNSSNYEEQQNIE